jgi:hypothetical protein
VENCHGVWNLEYEENPQAKVKAEICKRISGVEGVKWDKCGTERAELPVFCGKGTKIII